MIAKNIAVLNHCKMPAIALSSPDQELTRVGFFLPYQEGGAYLSVGTILKFNIKQNGQNSCN